MKIDMKLLRFTHKRELETENTDAVCRFELQIEVPQGRRSRVETKIPGEQYR